MFTHSSESRTGEKTGYQDKPDLRSGAIYKHLLDRKYELVNVIDVRDRRYSFFWSQGESWHGIPWEGDYDKTLEKFVLKELPDEESRQIMLHLRMDELVELLQREGVVRRRFKIRMQQEEHWKLVEYSFLEDNSETILQVISDIHDEQTLRERLKRESLEKEKVVEARRVSLENIGQEICSTLEVVTSACDALMEQAVSKEMTEDVKSIRSACAGLRKMTEDIDELSSVISGEISILPSEYRMSSFLMDVANLLKARLRFSPVKFYMDMDASLPEYFYGDDVRISQLLMHVFENAIKSTKEGSISFYIGGKKRSCCAYHLEISVQDTGTGTGPAGTDIEHEGKDLGLAISANLARIMGGNLHIEREEGIGSIYRITLEQKVQKFEPMISPVEGVPKVLILGEETEIQKHIIFLMNQLKAEYAVCRNLKESDVAGEFTHVLVGSQQLLAERKELEARYTRKKLILLLNQDEYVDINLMRYRQVTVPLLCLQLPRLLNSRSLKQNSGGMYRAQGSGFPFYAGRVLAVDNSRMNLEMTRSMLEPYMIGVDMAQDGMQALEMIKQNSYSMILMDHMMPDMDGLETLRRIRSMGGRYEHIPVIALTASAGIGMREEMLKAGFQDYLTKPVDVTDLKRVLDIYVANYKLESAKKGEEASGTREKRFFPDEKLIEGLNSACRGMDYDRVEELILEILYYSYPQHVEQHLRMMLECCEEFSYDELDRLAEELLEH